MKFFKSKFFVITVIVAVLTAVTFTVVSALGYSSYIRSGINVLLTPFRYVADKTGEALEGYAAYHYFLAVSGLNTVKFHGSPFF